MYCRNCGRELNSGAAFCPHCGAQQNTGAAQQNNGTAQPAEAKPRKGGKTAGIILLVLGALSVFGSFSNGTYASLQYGFDFSDLVAIGFQIGFIVGGIRLIGNANKG